MVIKEYEADGTIVEQGRNFCQLLKANVEAI
jgi:hypothetical protein